MLKCFSCLVDSEFVLYLSLVEEGDSDYVNIRMLLEVVEILTPRPQLQCINLSLSQEREGSADSPPITSPLPPDM